MLKKKMKGFSTISKLIFSIILLINVGCTPAPVKVEEAKPVVVDPNYDPQSKLMYKERFSESVPEGINVQEKFRGGHPEIVNYVFVKTKTVNLRERPATNTEILGTYQFYDILQLLGTVEFKKTVWYKVKAPDGKIGYVYSKQVEKRVFQFEKGLKKLKETESFVQRVKEEGGELAVINSYRPDPNHENRDKRKDKYGTTIDQNVVGNYKGETIIVPDRSIVEVLSRGKGRSVVKVASIPEPFIEIDTRELGKSQSLEQKPINKAVVVDITNQNMVIYEKIAGQWTIISYVRTKTGMESTLGFETPRGSFIAPVAKFEMLYNGEIGNKEGYAKYAIRFSGGGYLHGTPMGYEEEINKEYFLSLKEWTLGKYSGTRKCLRTDEDHAKFVFKWALDNKFNRSSNDQAIKDNILFVIY